MINSGTGRMLLPDEAHWIAAIRGGPGTRRGTPGGCRRDYRASSRYRWRLAPEDNGAEHVAAWEIPRRQSGRQAAYLPEASRGSGASAACGSPPSCSRRIRLAPCARGKLAEAVRPRAWSLCHRGDQRADRAAADLLGDVPFGG
jgi:hypothetical protein